ncbi:DUF1444 family protein [Paenisporosarcina indica]|uniref:DUF1444 family protein n=1 Tax=Paenisporosarcina indica TaxID=650093 RepID=UPI00095005DD|nr:DUF1444 family protein [Paenisporosarcina indica]
MKPEQLFERLKQKLPNPAFTWNHDQKTDRVRLHHTKLNKGMEISLPEILSKYEVKKDNAINEIVYTISQTFEAMEQETQGLERSMSHIYPVIRSTSFPVKSNEGHDFVVTDHTAETRIFYALDLGNTYRLLDVNMLDQLKITDSEVKEAARFQVRKLSTELKEDHVAGNVFYFVNANDGYDASRILNEQFLTEMQAKIEGDMTLSVPHQDVLIVGDIRNETGYDVLAQLTMHFFTVGKVPITSLSFIYEDGELEPIFILAKNRVQKENKNK